MNRKEPAFSEMITERSVASPWGWARLTATPQGLISCSWPWPEPFSSEQAQETARKQVQKSASENILEQAAVALFAFFSGSFRELENTVVDGRNFTDWQRKVYKVVRAIPAGEVRSYGWVAGACGNPAGARAVGQALARNPLPLFIPCHRVIYGDMRTGSYSCQGTVLRGAELKQRLLCFERLAGG